MSFDTKQQNTPVLSEAIIKRVGARNIDEQKSKRIMVTVKCLTLQKCWEGGA